MAQVIPPWADTVCERVGNTLEISAVLKPDCAICREARMPAPPPPTTIASKVMVRMAMDYAPPQIMVRPHNTYTSSSSTMTTWVIKRTEVAALPKVRLVR